MLVYFAMAFLIFEAFKLFIEIIAIRRNEKLEGNLNPNDVTFIISAWNV
ncbi:hypothetical protein M0Q50_10805 [bacterium]|jgi:hypothetical protein|nr:hypothetical protein [bacterium]